MTAKTGEPFGAGVVLDLLVGAEVQVKGGGVEPRPITFLLLLPHMLSR
jgi:hypothetical protein